MANKHHPLQSSQHQDEHQNKNHATTANDHEHHQQKTTICGPFHCPSMPHLPRFCRHRRSHAVKSLPYATLNGPLSPPSRQLFPSGRVCCLEIPPPPRPGSPSPMASPHLPSPTTTDATSPRTPESPSSSSLPAASPTPAKCEASQPPPDPPPPPQQPMLQPARKRWRNVGMVRFFCSPFRSLPIIASSHCKLPSHHGGIRTTGTLFGRRKARIMLAIQEHPRCLPLLLLEMAIPTGKLLQEMASGLVRIALECEKRAGDKTKLTEEPVWTMYCNGRKTGYGTLREATEEDLHIMQLLQAVSMGAGVLPNKDEGEHPDGELTYMRAFFDRVIGSKDSETYYMLNNDGNSGPELSIFFVRI